MLILHLILCVCSYSPYAAALKRRHRVTYHAICGMSNTKNGHALVSHHMHGPLSVGPRPRGFRSHIASQFQSNLLCYRFLVRIVVVCTSTCAFKQADLWIVTALKFDHEQLWLTTCCSVVIHWSCCCTCHCHTDPGAPAILST